MDQVMRNGYLVVMLILLAVCVGVLLPLYWTVFLAFTPDPVLNSINFILRYIHELVSHCNFALQYNLKGIKAILGRSPKGVKVVMPSARGRRVRIADEVSFSSMTYYTIRADEGRIV